MFAPEICTELIQIFTDNLQMIQSSLYSSVEKVVEDESDFDSKVKDEQDTVSPVDSLTSHVLKVFSLSQ